MVKHDLRHKARPIAGGHLTPPIADAYSGVVFLHAMRLALLIRELNGLNIMVGHIGNDTLRQGQRKGIFYFWEGVWPTGRTYTYYLQGPLHITHIQCMIP